MKSYVANNNKSTNKKEEAARSTTSIRSKINYWRLTMLSKRSSLERIGTSVIATVIAIVSSFFFPGKQTDSFSFSFFSFLFLLNYPELVTNAEAKGFPKKEI